MNRSKIKKLILFATIGSLIFCFIPAVQAKSTVIPIERWWEDNMWWYDSFPFFGGYADPDTNLVIRPLMYDGEFHDEGTEDPDDDWMEWFIDPLWNQDYEGFILVRELNSKDDYELMVTVHLHVKDAPFLIVEWGSWPPITVFKGLLDYTETIAFKLDLDLYPFQDENGWYLPIWWMPFFGWSTFDPRDDGILYVSTHFKASGEGMFENSWGKWEAGDTGKVECSQIALVKFIAEDGWDNHPNGHPNYYPPYADDPLDPYFYLYGELWPVEYIKFH